MASPQPPFAFQDVLRVVAGGHGPPSLPPSLPYFFPPSFLRLRGNEGKKRGAHKKGPAKGEEEESERKEEGFAELSLSLAQVQKGFAESFSSSLE